MTMLRSMLVFLYSLVITALIPVIRFLSLFHKQLRDQLDGRPRLIKFGRQIGKMRAHKKRALMILASSAGEYEQARPIIDRLTRSSDVFVHVVFWSQSGATYAKKRGETVSWSLAPFDTTWQWGLLFSAVSPNATIVIRHELWPAFLETAKAWGPCFLIDAVADPEPSSSKLKEMGKRFNLSFFDRIFTVSEEDAQSLRQKYGMTKEHVIAAGDTKYDRALERAEANQAAARQYLDQLKQKFPSRPIVVLGSVYTQDWTLCFGRADLIAAAAYLPLIVPHNVDSYTISTAIADAKNAGLQPIRWSQLRQAEPSVNVIIVDQLGCLAELYACANAAYVGGAQHHKVHNVLEPAAYNLPIAHGPKYQNSREAAMMSGLNKVVSTADEFADWVMTAIHEPGKTKSFVEAQAGATEFLTEKCWPETSRKSINPAPANSNV